MRIGLVGCGRIAPRHAQAAADSPACRITCCAARHRERAEAFAAAWGIPRAYGSLDELLASGGCDMVLLATWPADHLEQIRACCRAGVRAILCEKALAMNAAEGEEIRRIVEEAGAFLMEGLMYRHHPQIRESVKLVREGAVGEVMHISGYFSDRIVGTPDPDNWRFKPELGGGTMTAKGCYMVDAVSLFAGARPVRAISHRSMSGDGSYDTGHTATVVFANGATAAFESNHRSVWREEIRVYGTTGVLTVPHAIVTAAGVRRIVISRGGRFETEEPAEEVREMGVHDSYRLQLENVHACLFGGGSPVVPLEDSVANLRLTTALLKSADSGRFEPVEQGV